MLFFTQQRRSQVSNLAMAILLMLLVIPGLAKAQNELNQKLMMGYQGWFLANGDQSPPNQWRHWFGDVSDPSAGNLTVDMWPDMSEYKQTFATNMTYSNGTTAELFSSYDSSTTMVHFEWMKDYNIYGVYLQRFLGEAVNDPRFFQVRNKVLENVMAASQTHDRKFAMMYDISGVPDDGNLYNKLINDWEYLVDTYNMTQSNEYVKQNGLPVIAIWGIGFSGRGLNPATFAQIIDYFQNSAPLEYRAYVVGGVPGRWRTLDGDSESDPAWLNIYHSLDMISPWSVGRYSDDNGIDNWKNQRIIPDLTDCNNNGLEYMPVIWPGFSWYNLHGGPLNQISRNGGNFYWRQAYNAIDAGSDFIYVAMFDEVDEATAMFKIAETQQDVPVQGTFVTLDADGVSLPSDWYLRLADETQKMLDNTIPLSSQITISPTGPTNPSPNAPIGQTIWLRGSNNQYVCSENGQVPMICNRPAIGGWEEFTVVDVGNGKIALRGNNGQYVSSENGQGAMNCNRSAIGSWEAFDWVDAGGGKVALKGNNGRYVSSEDGHSAMTCNRTYIGELEKFSFGVIGSGSASNFLLNESPMRSDALDEGQFTVRIFPNPMASGKLIIEIHGGISENMTLLLYDLNGKLLREQKILHALTELSRNNLKSGIYMLQLQSKTCTIRKKIMIQ